MSESSLPVIYQFKVVLLSISPMIWRRVLVSRDSTIEDLRFLAAFCDRDGGKAEGRRQTAEDRKI